MVIGRLSHRHFAKNETVGRLTVPIAIALSGILGVVVALVKPDYWYLALGSVLVLIILVSTNLLLASVMLVFGIAPSTYLQHQIFIGAFPISGMDIVPLVFIAGALARFKQGLELARPRILDLVLAAYLFFFTCLAAIDLIVLGTNAYLVLQEYRSVLYLAGAYFATRILIRSHRHVMVLVIFALVAGVTQSIQEYWLIYTNASYNIDAGGIRQLRDSLIQPAAIPAILILALAFRSPNSIPTWLVWVLLVIYVPTIPLSFARNQWIGAAVAFLAIAVFVRSWKLVRTVAASALIAFVIVWLVAQSPLGEQIARSFNQRTASLLSQQDSSVETRIEEIYRVWNAALADPVSIVIGQGFGLASGEYSPNVTLESHNAYVSYFRIGGIVGLSLFLTIFVVVLKQLIVANWEPSGGFVPAIQLAVTVSLVFWIVTSQANRALFQWTSVPMVGIWLGLAVSLSDMARTRRPSLPETLALNGSRSAHAHDFQARRLLANR